MNMKKTAAMVTILAGIIIISGFIYTQSSKPAPLHGPEYLASCEGLGPKESGECVRRIQSNISICETLNTYEKNDCYSSAAQINANLSICDRIQGDYNDERKNNCIFGVAFSMASQSRNSSYCNLTATISDRDQCLNGMAILYPTIQ